MSIAKVIEIIAEGKTVEETMEAAIREAGQTVKDIQQIDVDHIHAKVENGKLTKYRINARISFLVKHAP